MPDTPEHPVTVGDLLVQESMGFGSHKKWSTRPATVADLVSALRAEGVLVVEPSIRGNWPGWAVDALDLDVRQLGRVDRLEEPFRGRLLDALAEAQP